MSDLVQLSRLPASKGRDPSSCYEGGEISSMVNHKMTIHIINRIMLWYEVTVQFQGPRYR